MASSFDHTLYEYLVQQNYLTNFLSNKELMDQVKGAKLPNPRSLEEAINMKAKRNTSGFKQVTLNMQPRLTENVD